MPIYEYRCGCGHITEVFQSMDSPTIHMCDRCGGVATRIISQCSFEIPGFKHGQAITEDDA